MIKVYGIQLQQITQNKIKEIALSSEFDRVSKKIEKKIMKKLEEKGVLQDTSQPMPNYDLDDIDIEKKSSSKNGMPRAKNGMKVSSAGVIMISGSLAKGGYNIYEGKVKNDDAIKSRAFASTTMGTAVLLAGLTNPALGVTLGLVNYLTNTLVQNTIQNKYDNQRLAYKMSNYDFEKYSTYVYNDGKYIAQDNQRVLTSILKRNSIS